MNKLAIGCHVSIAGGIWNAPKSAADLECETFQIFTRPPQGGAAPELAPEVIEKFNGEMQKYGYDQFVVHAPYYVNFGSSDNKIYYGSVSVIKQELARSSLLGAKFLMTHLGSFKNALEKDVLEYAGKGLNKVLEEYEGTTQLLLEIAAGGGNIVGDTFEELAVIMEQLVKFKTFGGICLDTQHAFASGYDLRTPQAVAKVFKEFDRIIGLKWLKMSHVNDSKPEFASHRDRHEHIGEGKIGVEGFEAFLGFLHSNLKSKILNLKSAQSFPLILETNHDKVESDIKLLKTLRDNLKK